MGVTPLPADAAFPPGCGPLNPFVCPECPFACEVPSFSEGGVKSPAPPGNDNEAGEVKAVACCAVDGCVVRVSILNRLQEIDGDRAITYCNREMLR